MIPLHIKNGYLATLEQRMVAGKKFLPDFGDENGFKCCKIYME